MQVIEQECRDGEYRFFVMEYLSGGDFRQAVLGSRLSQLDRMRVILEVGDALALAHRRDVIHRDVKPHNILLAHDGTPKLTDFDLVRAADTTGGTRTAMLGTFLYAAPEAMVDASQAAEPADVYGLGMTALFAIHGADPPPDVLRALTDFVANLNADEECRRTLLRAVAWKLEERWSTIEEFCSFLRRALDYDSAPASDSPPAEIRERTHKNDDSVLVYVPDGEFTLGEGQSEHRVCLSPFWIGRYPVTNAQYGKFAQVTGHRLPALWENARFNDPSQPVVGVSWHDAQAYCKWAELELPSEAQWEAAARGTDARTYPWGQDSPTLDHADFAKNGEEDKPDSAGSHIKGMGPYGTLDQAGGVWEWCADAWDEHAYKDRDGQHDPMIAPEETTPADRVLRGGAWNKPSKYLRTAIRNRFPAENQVLNVGFRVLFGLRPEATSGVGQTVEPPRQEDVVSSRELRELQALRAARHQQASPDRSTANGASVKPVNGAARRRAKRPARSPKKRKRRRALERSTAVVSDDYYHYVQHAESRFGPHAKRSFESFSPVSVDGTDYFKHFINLASREGGRFSVSNRTPLQMELDQILHSPEIEAHGGKQQVTFSDKHRQSRTRLADAMQTAHFARSLCEGLSLNPDFAEAVVLGSIVGSAPFWHQNKDAICSFISSQIQKLDEEFSKRSPDFSRSLNAENDGDVVPPDWISQVASKELAGRIKKFIPWASGPSADQPYTSGKESYWLLCVNPLLLQSSCTAYSPETMYGIWWQDLEHRRSAPFKYRFSVDGAAQGFHSISSWNITYEALVANYASEIVWLVENIKAFNSLLPLSSGQNLYKELLDYLGENTPGPLRRSLAQERVEGVYRYFAEDYVRNSRIILGDLGDGVSGRVALRESGEGSFLHPSDEGSGSLESIRHFLERHVFREPRYVSRARILRKLTSACLELLYSSVDDGPIMRSIEEKAKIDSWSSDQIKRARSLVSDSVYRIQLAVDTFVKMTDEDIYNFIGIESLSLLSKTAFRSHRI